MFEDAYAPGRKNVAITPSQTHRRAQNGARDHFLDLSSGPLSVKTRRHKDSLITLNETVISVVLYQPACDALRNTQHTRNQQHCNLHKTALALLSRRKNKDSMLANT
jgi:hypothetical protein